MSVYLPGCGGLGPDCNDNGEEFKWEKKGDQGRLQGGWKRLWHHCYSSSLSFCLSISLLQIPCYPSLSLGNYISLKTLCLPHLISSQLIPVSVFLYIRLFTLNTSLILGVLSSSFFLRIRIFSDSNSCQSSSGWLTIFLDITAALVNCNLYMETLVARTVTVHRSQKRKLNQTWWAIF